MTAKSPPVRAGVEAAAAPEAGALRPGEVLRRARANVEHIARGGDLRVVGEISSARVLNTGHITFDLKDARAKLPCIVFFNDSKRIKFDLRHGMQIVAVGKPSVTEWAQVQMRVVRVEPVGEGALDLAFRQLKEKLEAEGLFARERKRALPRLPRSVGIVTSSTGAAIRDALKVLFDRMPRLRVVVGPTKVQGDGAAADIADAIRRLDKHGGCDVLLVVRGGGSLEDLWAFNTEPVARAIAHAQTPVVAGVGHESDVTIADLVADLRAATPSNAAELAVPRLDVLTHQVDADARRLDAALRHALADARARLERARRRLPDPRHVVAAERRLADALAHRLERAVGASREARRATVAKLEERLRAASPSRQVAERRARLTRLEERLRAASPARRMATGRARVSGLSARLLPAAQAQRAAGGRTLDVLVARLDSISPLTVLARGYAIARRVDDGAVVRDPVDAPAGTRLEVRVERGTVRATVDD